MRKKSYSVFDQVVRWLTLLAMLIGAGPGAAPVALAAAPAAAPEAAAAVVPVTTGGATTLRLSVVSARTVGADELPPAGTGPSGKFLVTAWDAVPACSSPTRPGGNCWTRISGDMATTVATGSSCCRYRPVAVAW